MEFSPTLKQLAHSVGSISGHLTDTISDIKRLPDLLTRRKSMREAIYLVIAKDDEVKKTEKQINTGMQTNAQNLQNYLATWDNYRCVCTFKRKIFDAVMTILGNISCANRQLRSDTHCFE